MNMFEDLYGQKVKIVYDHFGVEKAAYGILLEEDAYSFKLRFRSGDIVGISKRNFIRISEEEG